MPISAFSLWLEAYWHYKSQNLLIAGNIGKVSATYVNERSAISSVPKPPMDMAKLHLFVLSNWNQFLLFKERAPSKFEIQCGMKASQWVSLLTSDNSCWTIRLSQVKIFLLSIVLGNVLSASEQRQLWITSHFKRLLKYTIKINNRSWWSLMRPEEAVWW